MAGKEALRKLEEELQCAICLSEYTDPKLLTCSHVFCAGCLPRLVDQSNCLPCPSCHKITPVPENGVKGLQQAFKINSLIEIHQSLKSDLSHLSLSASLEVDREEGSTSSLPQAPYCSEHTKQELKLYCEKCEKLVCVECAVDGAEHHTHKPVMLEKTCDRYRGEIRESLNLVKMQVTTINEGLSQVDVNCGEISQQLETIEAEINSAAKKLHQVLDGRTAKLIDKVRELTEAKLKSLAAQKENIRERLTTYQECEASVEEKLKTDSDCDVVKAKKSIMDQIESLTSSFRTDFLKPGASANLEFSSGEERLEYGELGEVELLPDPSKCIIAGEGLGPLEVDRKASVHVTLFNRNGELHMREIQSLECEFVSEFTGKPSVISFEKRDNCLYELSFTPAVKGKHQLVIKIDKQHIPGSPFTVTVHQLAEKMSTPISTITDVIKPWGVAINQEREIIVTEKGRHCVTVFSPQGERLRTFGTKGSEEGLFNKPCGVAVDDSGNIFIADSKNYRVQKLSADGKFIKAVGTKGNGNLQFEKLRGLAYNTFNSKVYVIDGNRIQVLTPDLSFVSSFGKFSLRSKEVAAFNMPVSIACDNNGQLYVSDCLNSRIVVLTPEGGFVKALGKYHVKGQTFNHPVGVAVDSNGLIYLSQLIYAHNRVSVVTPEESLVNVMDGGRGVEWGTMYTQIGLTVDAGGVLYVCELNNDRVVLW